MRKAIKAYVKVKHYGRKQSEYNFHCPAEFLWLVVVKNLGKENKLAKWNVKVFNKAGELDRNKKEYRKRVQNDKMRHTG